MVADYVGPRQIEVELPAGETLVNVTVPIVNDDTFERTETFKLTIQMLSQHVLQIGFINETLVTIVDDDRHCKYISAAQKLLLHCISSIIVLAFFLDCLLLQPIFSLLSIVPIQQDSKQQTSRIHLLPTGWQLPTWWGSDNELLK